MALFYSTNGNSNTELNVHEKEKIDKMRRLAPAVIAIQADGHELEHIVSKFHNLPMTKSGRVVEWFGDHAKFIARNF